VAVPTLHRRGIVERLALQCESLKHIAQRSGIASYRIELRFERTQSTDEELRRTFYDPVESLVRIELFGVEHGSHHLFNVDIAAQIDLSEFVYDALRRADIDEEFEKFLGDELSGLLTRCDYPADVVAVEGAGLA